MTVDTGVAPGRLPSDRVPVRERGFSLIDMLVVLGIVALLLAILMPAFSAVRESSRRVVCQSNLRQLMTAVVLYVNDNRLVLPFPNSEQRETPPGINGSRWRGPGWLYLAPARTNESDVANGALWRYLAKAGVYRCPNDLPPWKTGSAHVMTSYMMSGIVNAFDASATPFKLTRMKGHWVCFVEADDSDPATEPTWNDGYVDPEDGSSGRHKGGSNVACFDSHVEWLSQIDYDKATEANDARLWGLWPSASVD